DEQRRLRFKLRFGGGDLLPAATTTTSAPTAPTPASTASTGQVRGPEGRGPAPAEGEAEDREDTLPDRANHEEGLQQEAEGPRARAEACPSQEAQGRRQGQLDGRQGAEEKVTQEFGLCLL